MRVHVLCVMPASVVVADAALDRDEMGTAVAEKHSAEVADDAVAGARMGSNVVAVGAGGKMADVERADGAALAAGGQLVAAEAKRSSCQPRSHSETVAGH